MKLSLAPMAAAVEDAPLLPNAKKKGSSSVVRVSTVFGAFALSLLGVYLFAGLGGKINTNVNDNILSSSGKEKLHTTGKWIDIGDTKAVEKNNGPNNGGPTDRIPFGDQCFLTDNDSVYHRDGNNNGGDSKRAACAIPPDGFGYGVCGWNYYKQHFVCQSSWVESQPGCYESGSFPTYPFIKSGICDTSGNYNDVLPYLNHKEVIPGKIYYGLEFKDDLYKGKTYNSHRLPRAKYHDPCAWGDGKAVGRCILHGPNHQPQPEDYHCPSTLKQITDAWQQCAILCNDEPECHTFTVKTQALLGHRDYHCYFHKAYACKPGHAGIDKYVKQGDVRDDEFENLGVWSGICRTHSGGTSHYACTNTPIPTSKPPTPPVECRLCGDKKNHCCDSYGWNFHCPGCYRNSNLGAKY